MKEIKKRIRTKGIGWVPVLLFCAMISGACGVQGGVETIMGITHSDREGSPDDLKIGSSMIATGIRDGAVFHAKEIIVYDFD